MKILLARPVHHRPHEIVPDLGLGYLATSLVREGHHVRILDCSKEGLDHLGFADVLKKGNYDLVGLKTFSNELGSSAKMVRITKEQDPKPWVVIGGPQVSGSSLRTMEFVKEADFGFQGEAEIGLPMLVKSIDERDNSSYSSIPGLIFREDQAWRINPQVPPQDLDELGMPSWSLMPPQSYPKESFGLFVKNFPTAPIITTRGCPFHCTYCAEYRVTGRKFRKRSIDRIMEELSLLKGKFGVKDVTIVDDNFTLEKPFALGICEAIQRSELDFRTIKLSRELNLDRGSFSLFTPLPGTEIYEELVEEGRIEEQNTDTKGLDYDLVSVELKDLDRKELKRLQRNAILRFYLRPRVLWGILMELKALDQVKLLLRRLFYAMK